MSTNRSVGRSTSKPKKDRSPNLCAFTFADGRQCRTPRCSGHPHLCYYHAQKEAQALVAKQAGEDISSYFSKHYVSACDLTGALARVFRAVARGEIKPKAAMAMAYLGQTLVHALPLVEHEYAESFSDDGLALRHLFLCPPAPVSQLGPQAALPSESTPPTQITPSPIPEHAQATTQPSDALPIREPGDTDPSEET